MTCKKLTTCDEACYYFQNGYKALDRDKDGIPCEALCKKQCTTKQKKIKEYRKPLSNKTIILNKFFNKKKCDQILLNNGFFKTCYNYEMKGANFVAYTIKGKNVDKMNIKKRPSFYEDKNIPKQYRSHSNDYKNNRYKNDRGHLAEDASFDYSQRSLKSVYTMSNIIPQHKSINRSDKAWKGLEKFARSLAKGLGSINVLNGVEYDKKPKRIGRGKIAIPKAYWKILYNEDGYKQCFYFENTNKDKIKGINDYEVNCKKLIKDSIR